MTVSPTYARGNGVSAPNPGPHCTPQRTEPLTTKLFKNTLPPVADNPWALDSLVCYSTPQGRVPLPGGYPGTATVDPIPDIHPGTSLPVSVVLNNVGVTVPSPVPACLWNSWVLSPPANPGFISALWALGTADAAQWATDNGY